MIVKHRHGVEDAIVRRDAGGLADRCLIVDDVHQRYAVEDDVERAVRVRQSWLRRRLQRPIDG